MQLVTDLSRVFALCAATDDAIELRDDIAFFQAIKAQLAKTSGSQRPLEELDAAIRQLVVAFYDALAALYTKPIERNCLTYYWHSRGEGAAPPYRNPSPLLGGGPRVEDRLFGHQRAADPFLPIPSPRQRNTS